MFEIAGFARSRSPGGEARLLLRPTDLSICYLEAELVTF